MLILLLWEISLIESDNYHVFGELGPLKIFVMWNICSKRRYCGTFLYDDSEE